MELGAVNLPDDASTRIESKISHIFSPPLLVFCTSNELFYPIQPSIRFVVFVVLFRAGMFE